MGGMQLLAASESYMTSGKTTAGFWAVSFILNLSPTL